ncbi:unnamed protein product [Citrullus colocynthis]|uniref:Uncharacterized protein n=1 Tax=Citrullus colocynthis TaxID=252529 RepID=A0ABP0Y2Q9_9ROSI
MFLIKKEKERKEKRNRAPFLRKNQCPPPSICPFPHSIFANRAPFFSHSNKRKSLKTPFSNPLKIINNMPSTTDAQCIPNKLSDQTKQSTIITQRECNSSNTF